MDVNLWLWIAVGAGAIAVVYGAVSAAAINALPAGNARMQEIAAAVQQGAAAYLNRQYTTIATVGFVIFVAAFYLGWQVAVGFAIGAILSQLDASGRREDTVLVFMSDHGDYLGDHRLLLKGAALYQGIVRTPFLWSDPKSAVKGTHSPAIASTPPHFPCATSCWPRASTRRVRCGRPPR